MAKHTVVQSPASQNASTQHPTILVPGAKGAIGTEIVDASSIRTRSAQPCVLKRRGGTSGGTRCMEKLQNRVIKALVPFFYLTFEHRMASSKGVHEIVHTASPVRLEAIEPCDTIGPAVNGVLGMFKRAVKNGNSMHHDRLFRGHDTVFCLESHTVAEDDRNEVEVKGGC
ncbi:hypothetical protein K439DRAFT_1616157 [Ramaria rubella]|nr:hypothetical protein K439DRAFT_1616157 [Ramaria rubella]